MGEQEGVFIACVPDDGQWFDRGLRVEVTRSSDGRSPGRIEKAVFGTYEVLGCAHEQVEGQTFLAVRLQRFVRW
jgi:hypothetical protein